MLTFTQFLLESHLNVLEYFDQEQIKQFYPLRYKSKDKLVLLPIRLFLELAEKGMDKTKEKRVNDMIANGDKFSLPWLSIDAPFDSNIAKVVGHEGRHRGRALMKLGFQSMPVLLKTTIRWTEQKDPSNFDYRKVWPSRIKSENGTIFPFPISREESDIDNLG